MINKINLLRFLFFTLSIMFALLISRYFNFGSLEEIRIEIKELFDTELNNCEIKEIITKNYPGKGDYSLFKSDCNEIYHPILFSKLNPINKQYFKEGIIIKKEKNSYTFQLFSNNQKVIIGEFRTIEEEGDHLLSKYSIPIILGLFLSGIFFTVLNLIWKFY